jgi:hypothetical protein
MCQGRRWTHGRWWTEGTAHVEVVAGTRADRAQAPEADDAGAGVGLLQQPTTRLKCMGATERVRPCTPGLYNIS